MEAGPGGRVQDEGAGPIVVVEDEGAGLIVVVEDKVAKQKLQWWCSNPQTTPLEQRSAISMRSGPVTIWLG